MVQRGADPPVSGLRAHSLSLSRSLSGCPPPPSRRTRRRRACRLSGGMGPLREPGGVQRAGGARPAGLGPPPRAGRAGTGGLGSASASPWHAVRSLMASSVDTSPSSPAAFAAGGSEGRRSSFPPFPSPPGASEPRRSIAAARPGPPWASASETPSGVMLSGAVACNTKKKVRGRRPGGGRRGLFHLMITAVCRCQTRRPGPALPGPRPQRPPSGGAL